MQAGGGVAWKNPSEKQSFEVRGFVAVSMGCWRETALNGKTQAKIDILACEASMICRRGAALNGKTQARIKVFGAGLGANKNEFLLGVARLGRGYY